VNPDRALERLREGGGRITRPRRIVVEAALSFGHFFTATEIETEVLRAHPDVGRATIFRTLESLTQVGVLAHVSGGRKGGYTVCHDDDHHHHLVCLRCRLVVELPGCQLDEQMERLSATTAFRVYGHHLEYYGLCANCQREVA
jgi:Fur family transcriptional regulator, ferric uptake regulator